MLFFFACVPELQLGATIIEPRWGSRRALRRSIWTTPNGVERYLPHVKRGDDRIKSPSIFKNKPTKSIIK